MTLKRNFLFQNSDRGGATKPIFLPGAYPPTSFNGTHEISLMAQTRFHLPTTMERVNNHKTICLRLKLLKEMEKMISTSSVNTIRALYLYFYLLYGSISYNVYSHPPISMVDLHLLIWGSGFHIFFFLKALVFIFFPLGSKISKSFSICCID